MAGPGAHQQDAQALARQLPREGHQDIQLSRAGAGPAPSKIHFIAVRSVADDPHPFVTRASLFEIVARNCVAIAKCLSIRPLYTNCIFSLYVMVFRTVSVSLVIYV